MNEEFVRFLYPRTRLATVDLGRMARRKHNVPALLEVDVTDTRSHLRNTRRERGPSVSFNAWLIKTVSRTLESHPQAHAFRAGRRMVLSPTGIHIATMVERSLDGERVPLVYVVRNTETKNAETISAELEEMVTKESDSKEVELGRKTRLIDAFYFLLPGPIRRIGWRYILANPHRTNSIMGSALVTNISMMGSTSGWFTPHTVHPVSIGIGGIVRKPGVVNGRIAVREIMHMSVIMDHDVIDGAPMARFVRDLVQNIEMPSKPVAPPR